MRVLELSLRNYRVFEDVDLELPARVIGIFGANGAGKSSLMESMLFALYGRARTKRQEIRTQGVLTDCVVRLVFEHGGAQYEIRRRIRGRNHATDAELFVGDLALASGVTEVDAEVQRLLRMDQQVFRASVFAEQKQLDAFSDVTSAKRKEMVLRLLGIRPVDEARSTAKRESRAVRQRADDLGAAVTDLPALETALQEATVVRAGAAEAARQTSERLEASARSEAAAVEAFAEADRVRQAAEKLAVRREGLLERQKETIEARDGLFERLERLARELDGLPDLRAELASLQGVTELLRRAERLVEVRAARDRAATALEELPPVDEAAAEAKDRAASEAASAAGTAAEARARAAHADEQLAGVEERLARAAQADPSEPCPTCGRELGTDFAAYLTHAKRERKQAKERATAAAREADRTAREAAVAELALAAASRAFEAARQAADERARLAAQREELDREVVELRQGFGDEEPDPGTLRSGVERERELDRTVAGLERQAAHRDDTQRQLELAEAGLAELGGQLEELDDEVAGLAFDPERHERARAAAAEARAEVDAVRAAERAAAEALAVADREVSGLEGRLQEARETATRVDELRGEGRYLERVSMLLDGFRDHLVGRVGPELSREAESLFRELTNRDYDDLAIDDENLAIRIADGDTYFGIERFSGSEVDLANLALRVAISSHLSRVSGADVGLMVLDEVLGSLDVERRDLMAQTLGRLGARFHQLFVITHTEQVKDAFPASIEVRKTGRRRSEATLV